LACCWKGWIIAITALVLLGAAALTFRCLPERITVASPVTPAVQS
jgi:hypothetical protein